MATETFEQQIAAVMDAAKIGTLQLTAVAEDDGVVRFYTAMHGVEGGCVYSELMNLPTAREAVASGVDALNKSRVRAVKIAELAPMADAA